MDEFKHVLFIDIETVPLVAKHSQLSPAMQKEWMRKAKFLKADMGEDPDYAALFEDRAGVFSEFAKVVCIGIGSLHFKANQWQLRLKSLTNDNEKILLKDFCDLLYRFSVPHPDFKFCGHNIKEFDIPFLCRRLIINNLPLPPAMQLSNKKPWEVSHIDTMEMWRFGDYKNFTGIALLAEILGIPSPKDDLDGSKVAPTYWLENDLPRIAKYCLQDVLTTAKVFFRLKGAEDKDVEAIFVDATI
jgi:hypothetical protein